MGPITAAISDRNDRADMASRLKWARGQKRERGVALVSGDRVLVKNTQVAASKTQRSFAAQAREVTHVMGSLLRGRGAQSGREQIVHYDNCEICPHVIEVSDGQLEGENAAFRKGSVTATKEPLREASREEPPKKRARRGAREEAGAGAAAPDDGAKKNVARKKGPKGTPAKRPKKKGPMD